MKKLSVLIAVCLVFLGMFLAPAVQGQSGVNNADLNGNYAFTFNGMSGNGSVSSAFASVGRFTADGAGNLTNGELDTNGVGTDVALVAQPFTGTYSIGADHRGVMTFTIGSSTTRLAFAMKADGNAQFIEFDAAGGAGRLGSGSIEKADSTAFGTARITGDYAIGVAGFDNGNNRAAIAGRFSSNGTGVLTNAAGDVNAYGTDYQMNFTSANYAVSDTARGRGTMRIAFTFGGVPDTMNFAFYVVNSGKLFVMESDAVSTSTPLLNGVVVQQQVPTGGFTNGSLNGNSVIYLTGHSQCGTLAGVPKAVAGLLTTNGGGGLSLTYDENFCSAPNSVSNAPGSYSVASNGRTAITIGGYSLVAYLISANRMFLFVSDSNVLFGPAEPQSGGALANSAVAGHFAGVATNPVSFKVNVFSGEFSGDGANPTGHFTGAEDISNSNGTVAGTSVAETYSISSSPTNGRGTFNFTSPSGGNGIAYVVSPQKFVVVPMSDPNPTVWVFEQGPGATSTVTLSSLSLNPTSVTGGQQTSTGTVTLSGAAPAGGAQVSLSSSNTAVAQVPSSVTVPAGVTTATFTVSTSAVSTSTAITISAVYAGTTRTATLNVGPAAPPPASLASLSLNPTTVTGGTQSSTGTVTLSGAAPSGGAVVSLSSSNTGAARVPASVTVAAGATSASFTVSTSVVTTSTAVTISASYGGTTKTSTLTVNPAAPPPITLSSLSLNPTSVTGGTQSSTGTVTLSGAAPSGGAVVSLSSSNTGAAQTPSSVMVAAGATSASFTVSTSLVTSSTSVTITASYGGTTRTAALTVNPVPLPLLASMTLSPTSVVGGVQSSTGMVRLSGAAPAGGARIALSSSNFAASVPSSVTIPAGATSTTFPVNTSIVLISTSSTITASYNNSARSASLSVLL